MSRIFRQLAAAVILAAIVSPGLALAQKQGGVLKVYFFDSPASMSIHEEATIAGQGPMMGVFNNLVMYKQDVPQSGFHSIMPDLASEWSWDEDKTQLSFRLREGVKWHDGRPFTAKDVVCTWGLLTGKSSDKLRINPRKAWYRNLEEVVPNGDHEVTFRLKRPQPSFMALLASGFSPVYPLPRFATRDADPTDRDGPLQIRRVQAERVDQSHAQPGVLEKGPALSGRHRIHDHQNVSTGVLAFVAGKFDLTSWYFLQVPMLKDVKAQDSEAICELVPSNVNRNVMMNRQAPPFDNPELRRAVALTLDRKAFVDTLTLGKGDFGGAMLPPPEGVWGMPAEMLKGLPGYDPDVAKNRAAARTIMEKLGFGPDKRVKLTVSTRNIPPFRDPAVILIDQLKEIYIDAELEPIDTAQWFPKVMRGDYAVGLNLTGNGLDDPDQTLYENFTCGAEGNYDRYCNPELDKMVDRQSMEFDQTKRKELVWAIERKLAEDAARPILWHNRSGTWHPYLKGYTPMINSIYNGLRMEDVWLDK
jgi:peptide/nickel transport system substrate-binding protein